MVKHILYIKDLAGIDVIGLGTDFDGISCPLEIEDASMMNLLEELYIRRVLHKKKWKKSSIRMY